MWSLLRAASPFVFALRNACADADAKAMAIGGLLNPLHETVRLNTERFLQRIAQDLGGHAWLLSLLRAAVPRADSRPRFVQNFYSLFCEVVRGISDLPIEVRHRRGLFQPPTFCCIMELRTCLTWDVELWRESLTCFAF